MTYYEKLNLKLYLKAVNIFYLQNPNSEFSEELILNNFSNLLKLFVSTKFKTISSDIINGCTEEDRAKRNAWDHAHPYNDGGY